MTGKTQQQQEEVTALAPEAPPETGIVPSGVLNEGQIAILTQRTPPSEIRKRQGRGGMTFNYVEHAWVTRTLNQAFQWNWSFEITDEHILDEEVVVRGRLTINTPQGPIVKEQYGGSDIKRDKQSHKPLSVADDLKAAGSDALKKCASLLGVGLDLYSKDGGSANDNGSDGHANPPSGSGKGKVVRMQTAAKGEPAMITAAQEREIRRAAGYAGWPLLKVCKQLQISDLHELTEAKAARVLLRLEELAAGPEEDEAGEEAAGHES